MKKTALAWWFMYTLAHGTPTQHTVSNVHVVPNWPSEAACERVLSQVMHELESRRIADPTLIWFVRGDGKHCLQDMKPPQ